jgi:cobalt-precorrin 5A hydrolase
MVESHVGTPGVAEPAAVLALSQNPPFSGGQAHLIVHKTKSVNATIAIAEWQRNPDNDSNQ